MRNPTGKKLEKLIFGIFDDASQGVDRYNHNDSLWLIFTNEMKWVVEFTKDQTLWYNYNFFKDEMDLISLNCVEDKDLIKKWFESRFLGIPKVEDAFDPFFDQDQYVEDTIQNGVKHTEEGLRPDDSDVEDTIQNGVKHTQQYRTRCMMRVEDTIQNGVKQTELSKRDFFPKDIIKNRVRMTKSTIISQESKVEDAIQNGVKDAYVVEGQRQLPVKDTIQNGVKETIGTLRRTAKWGVDDIIQNGIKDTKSMCGKRGGRVGNTIQNGVKETHDDCSNNIARVEGIVRIGEKLN